MCVWTKSDQIVMCNDAPAPGAALFSQGWRFCPICGGQPLVRVIDGCAVYAFDRTFDSRLRTSKNFPLPSIKGCLEYGLTELAENLDAQLRMTRPEHLRNNSRNMDPLAELGQAGYMLASAVAWTRLNGSADSASREALAPFCYLSFPPLDPVVLNAAVSHVLISYPRGNPPPAILRGLVAAWCKSVEDPLDLIDKTCAIFEEKYA